MKELMTVFRLDDGHSYTMSLPAELSSRTTKEQVHAWMQHMIDKDALIVGGRHIVGIKDAYVKVTGEKNRIINPRMAWQKRLTVIYDQPLFYG